MPSTVLNETKEKMKKAIESLSTEFKKVRTGRASTSILEGVKVEAYGSLCPLNQVATVNVPDSKMISVQPFDPNVLPDIEKAIMASDLGLNPQNDGKVIRIPMPPLTEERRKEFVKVVKKYAEDARVSIRHQRREANDQIKELEKNKDISEDDARVAQKNVQDLTDQIIGEVDGLSARKEKEIMQV